MKAGPDYGVRIEPDGAILISKLAANSVRISAPVAPSKDWRL
jgi:hypothetical protein